MQSGWFTNTSNSRRIHILEREASALFSGPNEWLIKKLETVEETEEFLDAELQIEGETLSVNITLTPLLENKPIQEGSQRERQGITREQEI